MRPTMRIRALRLWMLNVLGRVTPLVLFKVWPLRKWYSLQEELDAKLMEVDCASDWVADCRTGVLFRGTDLVQ